MALSGHQAEPIRLTKGQNIYYRAVLEFCLILVNRRVTQKRFGAGSGSASAQVRANARVCSLLL
jgi:hypothetical protein